MPIILPHGLTAPEIRVLQEFRRLGSDIVAGSVLNAVKHPAGGGLTPANSLVAKGFLTSADDQYSVTEKGKEFLAYDPKPEFEVGSADVETAQ